MPEIASVLVNLYRPFHRRSKPGAAPGTVRSDPEGLKPVIRVIAFGPDEMDEIDVADPQELRNIIGRRSVTWINVDGLGDAKVVKALGEMFNLHPLAMEDVVHVHQRAKVEAYDDQLFICARMVALADRLETEQLSIFVGKNFVLTFQEKPGDCLDPVRERIRKSRGRVRKLGPDYLAYALLDAVVDGYFPVLEKYGERLDDLEDRIARRTGKSTITQVHKNRGDLLHLRRTIWPHREAINSLLRDEHPLITADTQLYLRDCYDHAVQLIDVAETYREMCSDLRDFHYSQMGQKTNDVMKVLTIIATIFIPLGFIAGLYGMNFDSNKSRWNMPELHWVYGYPFALGLMATVSLGMIWYFYRRGWLSD